jgi:uncharacterized membrane protein YkvA (DUF1232 family)
MKTASRIKLAATVASVVRAAVRPGGPSLGERLHAVPRLVRATVDGRYAGTTLARLGLVAGAVAYVASPIDLVPEAFLPVLGAADDAIVIGWAVKAFIEETDRFVSWELGQGGPDGRTVPGEAKWSTTSGRSWRRGFGSGPVSGGVDGGVGGSGFDGGDAQAGAPRADRDATGAAAPGPAEGDGSGRIVLPEGALQAATDYVMEKMRKRLER